MLRFSANLGFLWPERPLAARIEAAAAAGFRAIELHWPYDTRAEDLSAACRQHHLQLVALNTSPGNLSAGDFGLGALPGREADFARIMLQAANYARIAGAGAIHVLAGIVPQAERHAARRVFVDNLRQALEATREAGTRLLLEPLNRRDRPGYFYDRVEDAAEIIDHIGDTRLRLMFDCYHVQVGQGDVLRRLQRFMPVIGHVQIAAAPSRMEPDEGELAYGAVFEALARLGYDGWIGCEYQPRADTDAGLIWAQNLGVQIASGG